MGFSHAYWMMLACATLLGIGNNLWHPTAIPWLANRFPERKGLVMSFHSMGGNVGDALAPLVVGALLAILSWRDVVLVNVLPGIAMAALILIYIGRLQNREKAANAAKRSSRRALGSGNGSVTSARSTFAASTCADTGPPRSPGARRTIVPERSKTCAIAPPSSTPTQSPVTGVSVSRPRAVTRRFSASSATSQWPRYCASTRARVSSECNGGSPHQFARQGHDGGAGSRRVGLRPVQRVVAKM
jgi:hypothetical protein